MTKWISVGLLGVLAAVVAIWLNRPGDGTKEGAQDLSDGALPKAMMSTSMAGVADGAAIVAPVLPETMSARAQIGVRAFEAKCAECHGASAGGIKGKAPPLVHKIYEPGHHADFAFQMAVQNGVRAHHWPFGDMAPVSGLTKADVDAIVTYVRALQQANGIN